MYFATVLQNINNKCIAYIYFTVYDVTCKNEIYVPTYTMLKIHQYLAHWKTYDYFGMLNTRFHMLNFFLLVCENDNSNSGEKKANDYV